MPTLGSVRSPHACANIIYHLRVGLLGDCLQCWVLRLFLGELHPHRVARGEPSQESQEPTLGSVRSPHARANIIYHLRVGLPGNCLRWVLQLRATVRPSVARRVNPGIVLLATPATFVPPSSANRNACDMGPAAAPVSVECAPRCAPESPKRDPEKSPQERRDPERHPATPGTGTLALRMPPSSSTVGSRSCTLLGYIWSRSPETPEIPPVPDARHHRPRVGLPGGYRHVARFGPAHPTANYTNHCIGPNTRAMERDVTRCPTDCQRLRRGWKRSRGRPRRVYPGSDGHLPRREGTLPQTPCHRERTERERLMRRML